MLATALTTTYICRAMKVLLRFVLPICLLVLQGHFFLRPSSNPDQPNLVRIIRPRRVHKFITFSIQDVQTASFQKSTPYDPGSGRDDLLLAEAAEDDDDLTSRKRTIVHYYQQRITNHPNIDPLSVASTKHYLQDPPATSLTGERYIFHCVFRI